jgi:hypothetical protein
VFLIPVRVGNKSFTNFYQTPRGLRFVRGGKGKQCFVADEAATTLNVKEINYPSGKAAPLPSHGTPHDFVLAKLGSSGTHYLGLVVKRYESHAKQSEYASEDSARFEKLRAGNFPVVGTKNLVGLPPTSRLVEVKGVKYVAVTDLSKFGDVQLKYSLRRSGKHCPVTILDASGKGRYILDVDFVDSFIGKDKREFLEQRMQELTLRASKEHNMDISDSWELVIDSKNRTARAIILDVFFA